MMQKPTLLILAAGLGSRFGGLKQIDKIGSKGSAIIEYSIYDAIKAGFGKIVLVIRRSSLKDFEHFFSEIPLGQIGLEFVFQDMEALPPGIKPPAGRTKPWGTAHAILVASKAINEPFMVINADDFYGRDTFEAVGQYLMTSFDSRLHCMAGFRLRNTLSEHGAVSRGICTYDKAMHLSSITEITRIMRKDGKTGYIDAKGNWVILDENSLVSMNAWGFYPTIFEILRKGFAEFFEVSKDLLHDEYFISQPFNMMLENNIGSIRIIETSSPWFGLTYPEDKPLAEKSLQSMIEQDIYPARLWN